MTKKITLKSLNSWNKTMAALHALQGVLVLVLSGSATFPVITNYLSLDPASSANSPALIPAQKTLFDINLAYLVAAFFFMSAIAHLAIATVYRKRFEADLKRGINKARWIEYSVSASTMMVAIALLSGVYDISSLLMIFALTGLMNSMGLVMELWNTGRDKVTWLPFIIGSKAGIIPWIVLGIYFWRAEAYGTGSIPTFVYWIYVSIFIFFNSFAINMYLQYKKTGKWADYLYGERAYMILSLVAKSALAWQVFAGALRP